MDTMLTVLLSEETGMAEVHHAELFVKTLLVPRVSADHFPDSWSQKPGVYLLLSPSQNGWFSVHVGVATHDLRTCLRQHHEDPTWERALLVTKAGDTPFATRHVIRLGYVLRELLSQSSQAEVINEDPAGNVEMPQWESDLVASLADVVKNILGLVGYRINPKTATAPIPAVNPPQPVSAPAVSARPAQPVTAPVSTARQAPPPPLTDEELVKNLRKWRYATANEEGVPAYVIFTDKTMHAMLETRPITREALLGIPGMGAAKVDKYGPQLAHIIAGTTPEA